ncbi:hypothetical protein O0I10_001885 [Lichtheimia ornata]|uniref:MIF4G domain-containing protein n=1 Tax=Lichtheimia ornata TaxID=688661 RepID=A0AAD7VCK2_9FUNG|nr:uncharacterized protein O0I10_001885 [Lichtheimia ornata]KAJ8662192.1 hypothetical protein O0I10_001885 [Lichtheimia ornata]
MSKTPTPSDTSSKSQSVFHYAAAAKRSSQIQDQQGNSTWSSNTPSPSSSDKDNTNETTLKTATSVSSSTSDRVSASSKQHPIITTTTTRTRLAHKSKSGSIPRNASVQLPQPPPIKTDTIQFGSINQNTDTPPPQSLNITINDSSHILKSTKVKFGSLPATDTSSAHHWQGQPHIRIQQHTHPPPHPPSSKPRNTTTTSPRISAQQQQHHQQPSSTAFNPDKSNNNNRKLFTQPFAPQHSSPDSHSAHHHGSRHYRQHHYNPKHPSQHPSISPNMQHAHYIPHHHYHHQKKALSPHMATSPSMPAAQNIPMSHAWSSPGHVPVQSHQAYLIPQNYDNQPRFYPQYPISPYIPQQSPAYVTLPRTSKALPIINPDTKAEVKADPRSSISTSTSGSTTTTTTTITKEPTKSVVEERKKEEVKSPSLPSKSPTPTLKRIPIVDPAIANREKREREEAEQRAKEEAERRAKEEAEQRAKKEAEERAEKEELERKEREEKERLEAERKALEEKERRIKEEEQQQREEEKARQLAIEDEKKKAADEKSAKVPERLDLTTISSTPTSATTSIRTPSSPATRMIDDPSTVRYPPNIKPFGSKDPKSGKIQYDPAFLMQFAPLCLQTSEDLSKFRDMTKGDEQNGNRSMSSRRQGSERGRGPRTPSGGGDVAMFRHGSKDGVARMDMGNFASGGRPLTHRVGSGGHGIPHPGSAGGMQREGSHGGRGGRGGRGNGGGNNKGRHGKEQQEKQQQGGPTIPPEQVAPLEKSQNRWVPLALRRQREAEAADDGLMPDELIIRKVKALLNKLTLEKFDSISDQIWQYAKQSEKEDNGHSLRLVIELTFEKACDEPNFAMMWAQLCRKMYDVITDDIKWQDKEGNIVSGLNLFRKFLLNRCQHDFERGWKTKIPQLEENSSDMMSDEYYAAVKAKRQGLGLVQFIGELFKLHMLTDKIMIDCLARLADDPSNAVDEETETMCKLLTTVGQRLDVPKTRRWLDAYFARMKEMTESPNLSSRIKFMIMDVFDLRKNKWVSRRGNQPAPTTIAEIHEQAQKARNEEKEAMKRTGSSRGNLPHPMSRAGSHRGAGARDLQREGSNSGNASSVVDGWNMVGSGSGSGSPNRSNELANFGKTDRSKTRSNVLGPSNSPFASLNRASSKSGEQKSNSNENNSTNMFSALGGEDHDRSEDH